MSIYLTFDGLYCLNDGALRRAIAFCGQCDLASHNGLDSWQG
jgi:hypothetical protein